MCERLCVRLCGCVCERARARTVACVRVSERERERDRDTDTDRETELTTSDQSVRPLLDTNLIKTSTKWYLLLNVFHKTGKSPKPGGR